jgi:hypothetical protein
VLSGWDSLAGLDGFLTLILTYVLDSMSALHYSFSRKETARHGGQEGSISRL